MPPVGATKSTNNNCVNSDDLGQVRYCNISGIMNKNENHNDIQKSVCVWGWVGFESCLRFLSLESIRHPFLMARSTGGSLLCQTSIKLPHFKVNIPQL